MKRLVYVIVGLFFLLVQYAEAQTFTMEDLKCTHKKFSLNPLDLLKKPEFRTDNEHAVLELKTEVKDFVFKYNGKEIQPEDGENGLVLLLPNGAKSVLILHEKYGFMNWKFPIGKLKRKKNYTATIVVDDPTLEYEIKNQWLVLHFNPKNVVVNVDTVFYAVRDGVLSVELPVGKHAVKAESPFYEIYEDTLELKDTCKLEDSICLQPQFSYFSVITNSSDAEITLGGAKLGYGFVEKDKVQPGRYLLYIQGKGYHTHTEWVDIIPGEKKYVKVALIPGSDDDEEDETDQGDHEVKAVGTKKQKGESKALKMLTTMATASVAQAGSKEGGAAEGGGATAPALPEGAVPAVPGLPEGAIPAAPALPEGAIPATPALPEGAVPAAPAMPEGAVPAAPAMPEVAMPTAPEVPEGAVPEGVTSKLGGMKSKLPFGGGGKKKSDGKKKLPFDLRLTKKDSLTCSQLQLLVRPKGKTTLSLNGVKVSDFSEVYKILLKPGFYEIKLEKSGYHTYMKGVILKEKIKFTLEKDMERISVPTILKAVSDETEIWINRHYVGKGNWEGKLDGGFYTITAKREGKESDPFFLWVEDQDTVKVDMASPLYNYGLLEVKCNVTDADIYLNNLPTPVAKTPCIIRKLPKEKLYRVTVVKKGYKSQRQKVMLKGNDLVSIEFKLKKNIQ
ncbi:MAG TPA: hypothetical protein DDY68_01740 [Porphyromonadaceae bacterium]|nr:hypothetical protein [Porphyromonadaceae bacterium]